MLSEKRLVFQTNPILRNMRRFREVVFRLRISPRIRSQNRNGSKGSVRDLWGTNFCKNPRKSASLPCPFKGKLQLARGVWEPAQEKVQYYCRKKTGNWSPLSKYRWFGVYSMKKTKGRRKTLLTRANEASWLSNCSAPSPSLLKPFLCGENPVWL